MRTALFATALLPTIAGQCAWKIAIDGHRTSLEATREPLRALSGAGRQ